MTAVNLYRGTPWPTVSPDGRLSIDSEKGRHTLAPGEWDDLELKMLPTLDKSSLADIG
jgi:hypothetical protein